jgi:ParB-like chromosome segregation protein Spo0J
MTPPRHRGAKPVAPTRDASDESIAPPPLDASKYQTHVWPIGKVRRYSKNPRKNDRAVSKVASSLREFGWRQPIVVDTEGVIVAGDTRFLAAQELGYPAVPVWIAADLTEEQVRAYRIADNRTGEEAEWDVGLLGTELAELGKNDAFDLSVTGFDRKELERLLASDDGEATLEAVDVRPAPEFAWVLIGIPVHEYVTIAEEVERISGVAPFCEVTANSTSPAEAKLQT